MRIFVARNSKKKMGIINEMMDILLFATSMQRMKSPV